MTENIRKPTKNKMWTRLEIVFVYVVNLHVDWVHMHARKATKQIAATKQQQQHTKQKQEEKIIFEKKNQQHIVSNVYS